MCKGMAVQVMAVERASLSEYGEPFNRVGNQVDDAGTDGEGAEPWSRPNYFFFNLKGKIMLLFGTLFFKRI